MFSRPKGKIRFEDDEVKKEVKNKHIRLNEEELQEEEEDEVSNDETDEEEEEEEEDELQSGLKQELNKMSFEDVQKLQNKIGLKKFREALESDSKSMTGKDGKSARSFKRLNKNRPQEISSKRPVKVFRQVFQAPKVERIDPRFSNAFGEYKPDYFSKHYGFINELRENEIKTLDGQYKEEVDAEEKTKIKIAMQRLKQQVRSNQENEKRRELDQKLKEQALNDAKEGKKPHFVNKTERKILELAERYKELKKSGKVDKFLAKKRKKNLSKANKHLKKNMEAD